MSENAKITTLIENGTIVYPKTVKEAVYGLEEELNKKEVTIGSTPDEDAVLWIEPDGDVTTPIYAPNTAQVGQTIVVSAVDENGRPTAWKAVDMPQGGGGGATQRLVVDMTTTEAVSEIIVNRDDNGVPFSLRDAHIFIAFPANSNNAEASTTCWIFPDSKLGNNARMSASMANKTSDRTATFSCYAHENVARSFIGSFAGTFVYAPQYEYPAGSADDGFGYLRIESRTAGNQFAAGTHIVIWGVDQ